MEDKQQPGQGQASSNMQQPQSPPQNTPVSSQPPTKVTTSTPEQTGLPKVEGNQNLTEEQMSQVMKMREDKQKSRRTWTWVVIILIALFLLFASLIVFLLSQGTPENNPFLKLLGIQALNRQAIMLTLSNIGFGFLAFLIFIVSIVNLFKAGFAQADAILRKRSMILATLSGFGLLLILFTWVFTYFYLSQGMVRDNTVKPQTLTFATIPDVALNLTAPVTIEFDASPIQVDPAAFTLLSYTWDFGDKEKGTGKITSHTFAKKGTGEYEVVLTVKALDKKTQTTVEQQFKKIITIQNEKVKASFTATPEKGSVPLIVKFDASASVDPDGEIVNYEWDFNEDNQFNDASGVTSGYEYKQIGNFTARLRVTDNNNQSDVVEKTISVESANKLEGEISILNNAETPVTFTAYDFSADAISSRFGPIVKYEWNFGDGGTKESGKRVSHIFKKAGSFVVIMTAEDSAGNVGNFNLNLEIKNAAGSPTAVIKTNPAAKDGTVGGNLPFAVQFSASDSTDPEGDIVEYNWDTNFDGKTDKSGANISMTFEKVGSNEISLTVLDSAGNSSTAKVEVIVFDPGLQAIITADPPDGNVPLTVKFDASGSSYYQGKIVSYEWDFGDGTEKVLGDALISHEYAKIGTFEAIVTAIASDGKRASGKIIINIRPVSLQACYTANNIKGPAPLIVTFDPRCSTGTISEYRWNFGYEDKISRQRKPTHTFEQPGTYEVSLTVSDENNVVNTYKSTIVVTGVIQP